MTSPIRPGHAHALQPTSEQAERDARASEQAERLGDGTPAPAPPGSGFAGLLAEVRRLGCIAGDVATQLGEALLEAGFTPPTPQPGTPPRAIVTSDTAAVVLELLAEVMAQDADGEPLSLEHLGSRRHAFVHRARRLRTVRDDAAVVRR